MARYLTVLLLVAMAIAPSRAQGQSESIRSSPGGSEHIPGDELLHRVFLIGDTGGFNPDRDEPILALLHTRLVEAGSISTVVFLGDNIYPRGLPDSSSWDRDRAERRLVQQLDAVKDTGARIVFIPGNHDWQNSGPDGLDYVLREERFVETYLAQGDTFLPSDGLPGPDTVELAPGVVLVALDTEWWLRTRSKGFGDAGRYETREEGDLLANLADVLRRNDDARLLVVGHHPMMSNGAHGGGLPLKAHVFPLTELWDWAYFPLPVIGSLYPVGRSLFGGPQDLSHPRYRSLRTALTALFDGFDNHLVYASGHDHALQHFPVGKVDYVVSGSSSRPTFVSQGRGSAFASSEAGFMELQYFSSGATLLLAHTLGGVAYQAEISPPAPSGTDLPRLVEPDAVSGRDTTFFGAAAPELEAGPIRGALLGQAHRAAWTTSVHLPVLDVDRIHGGLRPVQRGGGQQTVSLRLENPQGHQFVLRSLAKDPTKTLPDALRQTVARDIVLDQVSILHPYGALLVPPLAKAVGIYYATPQVFFVPDDPRLAPYSDIVGGRVMMLEERPADDMSHAESFGRAPDVIGASKMYKEITEDNDHRVDARFFARNRILDMYMSDWDRHVDQWRWAAFEPPDRQGKIYRAIPRDRDWAFNKMDGLFPNIIQSEWVLPKFQEFKEAFGFMPGLNFNGMPQDRRLTAALTPQDWVAIADSVSAALSDTVIASALGRWPPEIRELDGSDFERIFRARRDGLAEAVHRYTDYLDHYVDIVMSDKHEEFVVTSVERGGLRVTVYKTTKEGVRRKVLYDRAFDPERTREIRLYGMGGRDRFNVAEASSRIRVHVIGGTGDDELTGSRMTPRSVFVYDTHEGMSIDNPGDARLKLSGDPLVNRYDPMDYRFNATLAAVELGYDRDNGLMLGGGPVVYRHAYRALPFAARHKIVLTSAARFAAVDLAHESEFTGAAGSWNAVMTSDLRSADNIRNFFGLGNETVNERPRMVDGDVFRAYYQVPLSSVRFTAGLRRPLSSTSWVMIGTSFQRVRAEFEEDRFVAVAGLDPSQFKPQMHAGVAADLTLDTRDSRLDPARGLLWTNSLAFHGTLSTDSDSYWTMSSAASAYYKRTVYSPHTLAARVGFEHRLGSYPFLDAATVGGSQNLRGWRSDRFAGRTAVFQNLELRSRLKRFSGYLAQGKFGSLLFVDHGRVWTDNSRSSTWHRGAGFGLWTSLFDAIMVSGSIGFSKERTHVVLKTGFLF